jgi:hypothetical protein
MAGKERPTIEELHRILNSETDEPIQVREDGSCYVGSQNADNGPCRETAATLLQRAITRHSAKLAGLEHLLKIAEKLENGSPAEEMLWRLLQHDHNNLFC